MIRSLMIGALLCLALRSMGCDVCGIFLNVQPNDRSTQFGLLYRTRALSRDFSAAGITLLKHGGTVAPLEERKVRELMQALELRADIRLAERWVLLAAAPVVNTYQSVNGYVRYDAYGLGDPFAILRYQLVNTKCLSPDTTGLLIHRLLVGAGVKAPLGRSDVTYLGERLHPDAQPGTGSWDALVSLEYAVRSGRNGLLFTALGRLNTADTHGVRLGHTASGTLELFRTFKLGAVQVMPSLGAYLETAGHDDLKGTEQEQTGGTTWFGSAGLRAYWKNWMLSATYQKALGWNIGDEMTATDTRVVAGLSYFLKNN
ncbi:MAG: hypothetical protein JST66_01355 [Bacteroidetes bacterium]|nr:hypothetical protein [Bacteroidota bacterium]